MKYKVSLSILALVILSLSANAQVQKIMTLAGTGFAGFFGDGINASSAQLWGPIDVKLDRAGNVYFLDFYNNRIRKINTAGVITTIAGTGTKGNTLDGSIGTSADIYARAIAVDKKFNVYFTDETNAIVRKINSLGIISHFAGKTDSIGYRGDGGKADTARFSNPHGIAIDDWGTMYIADAGNHRVRKIDTFGFVSTVAGNGVAGYFGDGGLATFAELDSPYALTVDHKGVLYINDFNNNVIRMVDLTGTISTVAGSGAYGYSGDNGLAVNAMLNAPRCIGVDTFNNLFIADALNNVIRKVDNAGVITTVAGNGSFGFGGDLWYVTGANFKNPYGVAVDVHGSIYIGDANNERIRKTYATTAVNSVVMNSELGEFPNPSYNMATITGLSKSDQVSVYDMAGRQVGATWNVTSAGEQTFDVSFLNTGIYTIQVADNNGNRKGVLKLVKE